MKYITVYKDAAFFSSFPSLCILPDDSVLVVFRRAGSFSVAAAKVDHPTHHDTDSQTCVISSSNGGEFYEESTLQVVTDVEHGVNDPGVSLLSDGRLILRNTLIQVCNTTDRSRLAAPVTAHRPDLGTISAVIGQCVQFSADNGKSWSSPQQVKLEKKPQYVVSREQVIELEDKTLLMSVYTGFANTSDDAYVIRSWNGGTVWQDSSLIASDENGEKSIFQGISFNETAIINLGAGKIMALIRADSDYHTDENYMAIGGVGQLFQAYSYNAGFSWTKPNPTGIFGQPAHLLKLDDGRILCTYGYRKDPFGIKAVISSDDGATWDIQNTITLKEKCLFWDMGYPVSAQRADGKIVTVYYWVDDQKTRFIESVIWDIKL